MGQAVVRPLELTPGEPACESQATEVQVKGVSGGQKDGKKIQGNLSAGKGITQRWGGGGGGVGRAVLEWGWGVWGAGRYWSGGGGCRGEVAGPAQMWSDSDMTELRQGDIKRSVWGPLLATQVGGALKERDLKGRGQEG